MDNRSEIRAFLTSRRAKIGPEQAGLPAYGGTRRVPGLRRGEVATLAGVSIEYYTRLERGNLAGASEDVLEAVARALRLDEAERSHLFDLARAAGSGGKARRRPAPKQVRTGVQLALNAITGAPAYVGNGRLDILAANQLGYALYTDMYASPERPANHARFIFLDDRSRSFYPNWNKAADDTVAILHTTAGRDPYDRGLTDLIGELSTRSDDFRSRWATHNVRQHFSGRKHFHHPIVGELHLLFEAMELSADTGLSLYVYSPEPGTPSDDAIRLLASWAATNALPAPAGSGQSTAQRS
ncbi:MAG: transcriptional regulator [Arthrobacter sp.]|jgi:transcriptional regulator with XRE-family HTH domain|nr:transcriptional regulator [Arthrobacter sp.]